MGPLVDRFISDPAMQAMALGVAVKIAVDKLKFLFTKVDKEGVPEGYKMPLQLLVMALSGIAAMGDLALKGSLASYDPSIITTFLTVTIPTYFSAIASHRVGNMLKNEIDKTKK